MQGEDEDKPTVVLDFNTLKAELQNDEKLIEDESIDIQFAVELEDELSDVEPLDNEASETEEIKKNIYLFEYQTDYFQKNVPHYRSSENIHLVEDLKTLNQALTEDPESIIVFYYNASPKAINQLSKQINDKFKATKTMIIAKNLSAEKAAQHSKTKYAADTYLSDPFEITEFYQTISALENR